MSCTPTLTNGHREVVEDNIIPFYDASNAVNISWQFQCHSKPEEGNAPKGMMVLIFWADILKHNLIHPEGWFLYRLGIFHGLFGILLQCTDDSTQTYSAVRGLAPTGPPS